MSRSNKDFNNKRNELLEKIWDIFIVSGYENTTLSFIIKTLDISKGSFYHYFASKEECADAAIEMRVQAWIEEITKKTAKELKTIEKFKKMILTGREIMNTDSEQNEKINSPSNLVFHEKLLVSITKKLAPLYAEIISQGTAEKIFNVKYPLESAEMILTLSNFYLDADLFKWDKEIIELKVAAFKEALERILGAKKDLFSFTSELFDLEEKQ